MLAAAHHASLRIWTNPDERSAAFLALGIAKGSGQPAALICTSGTAAANYFPAVIEAAMAGVPMVVVTADRPPSLRGTGAPQTINQINLYGEYALSFNDLPVPGSHPDVHSEWARACGHVLNIAVSKSGVVHINAPFEEPLLVEPVRTAEILAAVAAAPIAQMTMADRREPTAESGRALESFAQLIRSALRPVIICGSNRTGDDFTDQVVSLANNIGAPIFADVASQLRSSTAVISHYDLILRDEQIRTELAPDAILRLGGLPTSKALNEWIAATPARVKIGIAPGPVADPHKALTHSLRVLCVEAVKHLIESLPDGQPRNSTYSDQWKQVDQTADLVIAAQGTDAELLESRVVMTVCENAGRNTNLFLSNSMPIRWADMYARAGDRFPLVYVNRGANGIDGIISTAAGVAASTGRATVCVIGDLTFLHDQNGLWRLNAEHIPLKLILLNNDGGGVFHFLPISSHADHFERLVAMPHSTDMSCLAAAHGIRFQRAGGAEEFDRIFDTCVHRPGPDVIEIKTDRTLNHKRHQSLLSEIANAVRKTLGIG